MPEPVSPFLTVWSSFYIMTGSAAAALTGLTFVVITLVTARERTEGAREGIATFTTPTVMHFASALLVSALLTAPWHALTGAAVAVALIGLGGVAYILRIMHRMRRTSRQTNYQADLDDWIWYTLLPFVAYGGISAGAIILEAAAPQALFVVAGGVLLLLFIGIRNAWDIVTYIAISLPDRRRTG